jgi:hypothetical protein
LQARRGAKLRAAPRVVERAACTVPVATARRHVRRFWRAGRAWRRQGARARARRTRRAPHGVGDVFSCGCAAAARRLDAGGTGVLAARCCSRPRHRPLLPALPRTSQFAEPPPGVAGAVGDARTFTVIRRFSDFVWLRGALRDSVPWAIVPALPDKQQIGRFSADFVDIRLRALQRWMERVTASPELVAADPLRKFATLPYDALAAVRDGSRGELVRRWEGVGGRREERREVVGECGVHSTGAQLTPGPSPATQCSSHPPLPRHRHCQVRSVVAESRARVMRLLKTATTTLTTTIAEVRSGSGIGSSHAGAGSYTKGSSADDAAFASIEAYLLGQAGPLTAVYNASAALAVRYREQAQLLLDHGASLRSLGGTEGGPYGASLSGVGLSTWAASTAAYEQVRGREGAVAVAGAGCGRAG